MLQITTRDVPHSEALESHIRQKAEKLRDVLSEYHGMPGGNRDSTQTQTSGPRIQRASRHYRAGQRAGGEPRGG